MNRSCSARPTDAAVASPLEGWKSPFVPVIVAACLSTAGSAAADDVYVGVRCPTALFALTAGPDTDRSSMEHGGVHRVWTTTGSDEAELDCDTGCGSTTGDGACLSLGAVGNSTAEALYHGYAGEGWSHAHGPTTPVPHASVDVKCGDDWFRLKVPTPAGGTSGTTRSQTGGTANTTVEGKDADGNATGTAWVECEGGEPTLGASGDGEATCCTCYSPTPCG